MNETDFIRRQLALERAHLREILQYLRGASSGARHPRPLADYIDWGSRRLLAQLGEPSGAVTSERLLALIEIWSERLESPAGGTPGIGHWRRAAQLSADSILEERRLYAAARTAAGLP
jgi:hypothetical protein